MENPGGVSAGSGGERGGCGRTECVSSGAVSASCGGECVRVEEEERGRTSGGQAVPQPAAAADPGRPPCVSERMRGENVPASGGEWGEHARTQSLRAACRQAPEGRRGSCRLLRALRRGSGSECRDCPAAHRTRQEPHLACSAGGHVVGPAGAGVGATEMSTG